jgi:hypothetical protein
MITGVGGVKDGVNGITGFRPCVTNTQHGKECDAKRGPHILDSWWWAGGTDCPVEHHQILQKVAPGGALAQFGRAAVSQTAGWWFKSIKPHTVKKGER